MRSQNPNQKMKTNMNIKEYSKAVSQHFSGYNEKAFPWYQKAAEGMHNTIWGGVIKMGGVFMSIMKKLFLGIKKQLKI